MNITPRLFYNPLAIAEAAGALLSAGVGIFQRAKGNKLLKGLQYPTEGLPDEYSQNQQLATKMAAEGIPSEQYAMAMKNIQRQQLAAIRGAQDRRAGVGLIPSIQSGTNDATLNLDTQNALQRTANQRQLMTVNNWVGGQKRNLFDYNVRSKYNRDYDYAMKLLGQGNQNIIGGADRGITAGIYGGMGSGYGTSGRKSTGGYTMTQSEFEGD